MDTTEPVYIGVDSSTTATKAIVWAADGTALAEGRAGIPLSRPGRGRYEQRPQDWWGGLCTAMHAALAGIDPARVAAVSMANQRETVAALDAQMQPIRPALVWSDERGREQVAQVAASPGAAFVHDATGKPVELCPALYRILWLRDEEPETYARTAHFVDVQGYLNWALTGQLVTSWASGDPFGLLDMRRFAWHTALIERLGLRPGLFAPLVPPGTQVGRVSAVASASCGLAEGTPVVAGGGDGQVAGLGARALRPGRAYCNLGTAVVAGVQVDRYLADPAFRTMTSCVPGAYICETLLRTGTSLVTWFVEHFGPDGPRDLGQSPEELMEAEAARISPGCEGLILLPHWNAAATPHWDTLARGAVVGWTPAHGKAHFYRSVLEGVAMELRLTIDGIARVTDEPISQIVITGGGSRSPLWRQIIADVTGRPIIRMASAELSSLGAGILAATGVGAFRDLRSAAEAMSRDIETIAPDPARQELYTLVFERAYRPLYPALREITHAISAIEIERGWSTP